MGQACWTFPITDSKLSSLIGLVKQQPGAILLPLVPLIPWIALIMQPSDSALALLVMPVLLFMIGMMAVGAWIVWRADPWLGVLTAWWVIRLLWNRTPQAFETGELCVLGTVSLVMIQRLPRALRELGIKLAIIGVIFQAFIGLLQAAGVDPVWDQRAGGVVVGVLGNPGYLSGLFAPFVPLVSWPFSVLLMVVMVLAHSKLACVAAGAGLALRYRGWWREWLLGGLLLALIVIWIGGIDNLLQTSFYRVSIWQMAFSVMSGMDWIVGKGLGSWITNIPNLQHVSQTFDGLYFTYAHSEWVQLLYENGAIGVGLVMGWLWSHRNMLRGPYAGAVLAILVMTTLWFVFHLANLALPFLVILGAASAPDD